MARRIMRSFVLKEISGVDRPAQAHARAVIMKSAHQGAKESTTMSFSKAELEEAADAVLTGAAVALRKREPHLSPEQAYAAVFTSPDYREAAKAERAASQARLAGVPVARTAATILNSLDDNSINALTVEIKNSNPFLDDAGIVRLLLQRVEQGDYRGDVAAARRAGDHAPGAGESLTAKALSNADLRRMVDHERFLNPTLSDEALYRRVSASRAARLDRRELAAEMEAERRDDVMSALDAKADELRAANPELTKEMAFAAAYTSPANRELAKLERAANRPEG